MFSIYSIFIWFIIELLYYSYAKLENKLHVDSNDEQNNELYYDNMINKFKSCDISYLNYFIKCIFNNTEL